MRSLVARLGIGMGMVLALGWSEACAQTKQIRTQQRVFDMDGPVYMDKRGSTVIPPAQGTRQDSKPTPPTNWVVAGAKPVRYDGLELRIISGPTERRLATINNQTFLAGETLKVVLRDTNIPVRCLEIRDRSVLVKVQGEENPRELKLQAWQ